ncbi:hypothetical protein LCGC14_0522950 [marine sediment metagenome]|uniref:Uncharacterized protein n=1 Tax=marine sediment metagenome TaxID=412755 RepID=A0A0F9V687_9ZZZZ
MARRRHYGTFMGPDGLSPLVGAAAGAGVGTITAIAVRRFSSMDSWSELVGMGGGVLTGLVMMFPEGSRQAGIAATVTAILNNGVRFAASKIFEKEKIRDAMGELATLKEKSPEKLALKTQYDALVAQIETVKVVKDNMGLVRPEQVPTLAGGLGAVSAHPMQLAAVSTHDPGALGTLSVRDMPLADGGETGAGPPVQLVGLGKHYGATIYGSR